MGQRVYFSDKWHQHAHHQNHSFSLFLSAERWAALCVSSLYLALTPHTMATGGGNSIYWLSFLSCQFELVPGWWWLRVYHLCSSLRPLCMAFGPVDHFFHSKKGLIAVPNHLGPWVSVICMKNKMYFSFPNASFCIIPWLLQKKHAFQLAVFGIFASFCQYFLWMHSCHDAESVTSTKGLKVYAETACRKSSVPENVTGLIFIHYLHFVGFTSLAARIQFKNRWHNKNYLGSLQISE